MTETNENIDIRRPELEGTNPLFFCAETVSTWKTTRHDTTQKIALFCLQLNMLTSVCVHVAPCSSVHVHSSPNAQVVRIYSTRGYVVIYHQIVAVSLGNPALVATISNITIIAEAVTYLSFCIYSTSETSGAVRHTIESANVNVSVLRNGGKVFLNQTRSERVLLTILGKSTQKCTK